MTAKELYELTKKHGAENKEIRVCFIFLYNFIFYRSKKRSDLFMIRSKLTITVQGNGNINKVIKIKDKTDVLDFYNLIVDEVFSNYKTDHVDNLVRYMTEVIEQKKKMIYESKKELNNMDSNS